MRSHLGCVALLALCQQAASVSASATCRPCPADKFLTVKTSNGPVTGHLSSNSKCVVEYLGIPYAKPPVGDLRFEPPQRFVANKPYEAAEFGFDCPLSPSGPVDYPGFTPQAQRIINNFASATGKPQGEDCLTLNIWSKATSRSQKQAKPVVVFFYGGRFTIGSTDSVFYDGKYFAAAEDVIVVTVNYRINIFGFPGAPGQEQNAGLRDQRAAVEWVRDNIAKFGGNPNKITISGQSSGGVSVDYWAYAYQKDPIVNGIIAPSGDAFSFPVNSPGVPEKNWNSVVAAVGCADAADTFACMKTANWEDIKNAAAGIKPGSSTSVLRSIPPFYPIPDNKFVFPDYVKLTEAGKFAKVPIYFGNNENEAGYYRIPAFSKGVIPTDAQVASFLLESFTCPIAYQARARRAHDVPVWIWRYFGDWDNTRLYPTSGAYHGSDLEMIFGASEDVSGLPTTAEQRKLTKIMQHAWFSFSDNPKTGLSDIGFPMWDPAKKSLIVFGRDNKAKPVFVKPSDFDAPCSTITLGALGTPTPTVV